LISFDTAKNYTIQVRVININKFTNHIKLLKLISANIIGTSQPANLSFNILDIKREISAMNDDPHIFYSTA